ncbi:DUF4355 domain-containing protein [Gemella sp. 19428wG2_WT2a]|nr:DUF4355 domain-containing protein [Gemella sp. 19428wG2_WT2a]TFU57688.1 DUF4355 domain-containing protein [Gemella sp. WT2a]
MENETKTEVVEEVEKVDTQTEETTEKTFTQEQVDKIIKERLNRALSKKDEEYQLKMSEAEKLRKMSEEEKAKYEKDKTDAQIKELEAELARHKLEKVANISLAEKGIVTNEEVLNFVVKDTAEATDEAINLLVKLIEEQSEIKVKELMKGKTPLKISNATNTVTKEQFSKMSYRARLDLQRSNPNLYNELKG